MTLPERAIFQIARMVLATRVSRNLFAVYCMALHLLVFAMLLHIGEPHGPKVVRQNVAGPLPANEPGRLKPDPKFR
jgi:homeobox protein cut-like